MTNTPRAGWQIPTSGIVTSANIESLFCQPLYLRQAPVLPWLRLLFWLVLTLRPRCVLTMGLGNGVGHFALAQAMARTGGETCLAIGTASPDMLSAQARYPSLSQIVPTATGTDLAPNLVLIDRTALPEGPAPDLPAATVVLLGTDDLAPGRQRITLPEPQGLAIILSGHETAAPLLALRDACTDGVLPAGIARLFRLDIAAEAAPTPAPETQRLRRRLAEAGAARDTAVAEALHLRQQMAQAEAAQQVALAKARAAVRRADERLASTAEALAASKTEAQAAKAAAAQASRRLDRIAGLLKAARTEAQTSNATATQTAKRLETTQEALKAARANLQTERATGARTARHLARTERALATAQAASATAAGQNATLRRQIAALRQNLAAARTETAAMIASRSWRLTAPLRWLRRWRE